MIDLVCIYCIVVIIVIIIIVVTLHDLRQHIVDQLWFFCRRPSTSSLPGTSLQSENSRSEATKILMDLVAFFQGND
jgi:hypothetical protein